MIKVIKIKYDDFKKIKNSNYNDYIIKMICAKYCECDVNDIDDIDFDYKLTITVYLKERKGD